MERKERPTIALDLDRTLIPQNASVEAVKGLIKRREELGLGRKDVAEFLIKCAPGLFLYGLGKIIACISKEKALELGEKSVQWLGRAYEQTLRKVDREAYERIIGEIADRIRRKNAKRLMVVGWIAQLLRNKGYRVVVATASPEELVRRILPEDVEIVATRPGNPVGPREKANAGGNMVVLYGDYPLDPLHIAALPLDFKKLGKFVKNIDPKEARRFALEMFGEQAAGLDIEFWSRNKDLVYLLSLARALRRVR